MKRVLGLTLSLAFVASLAAEDTEPGIYRSKDRHGNTVFSDQPGNNAERVELQDTNRTPAVKPQPRSEKPAKKDAGSEYVVSIAQPENNSVVANGLLPTRVSVNVDPPMLPKHKVEFLLDGKRLAVGSGQEHTIDRLTPGAHRITAQVVDEDGKLLGKADSVKVTAYWPGNR